MKNKLDGYSSLNQFGNKQQYRKLGIFLHLGAKHVKRALQNSYWITESPPCFTKMGAQQLNMGGLRPCEISPFPTFFSFYRAMLAHSAVMRLHVVCPSICLPVC